MEQDLHIECWEGNLIERGHLGDHSIYLRRILKWMLGEQVARSKWDWDWIGWKKNPFMTYCGSGETNVVLKEGRKTNLTLFTTSI